MLTPGYMRRMRLGQYRERELLSRRWLLITALGFFAAAGILILAAGCKSPSCTQLTQARDLACHTNAQACEAAQKALDAAYPNGCPTPEPTVPPVTQPSPTPTPEPTDSPTPPATGCVLADQAGWVLSPDQSAVRLELVREWVATVKSEHPDWFTDGGARLANRSAAGVDAFYDELGRVAARSGFCAGQVREYGGRLDKFGVMQPGSGLEAYHLVEYGAFRLQNPIKVNSVWVPPAGTPPITQPTPMPSSTAAPSACPAPRWESYKTAGDAASCSFVWGLKEGHKWIDATLTVQRCCAFCQAIGMGEIGGQMRCQCPLRPEGNAERFACEAEVGAIWKVKGGTLIVNPDNLAQANCEGVGCQVQVCTKSGVCSAWAP